MPSIPLPKTVCPRCGSSVVRDFGRDEISRYARELIFHASQCTCGCVFTTGRMTPPIVPVNPSARGPVMPPLRKNF